MTAKKEILKRCDQTKQIFSEYLTNRSRDKHAFTNVRRQYIDEVKELNKARAFKKEKKHQEWLKDYNAYQIIKAENVARKQEKFRRDQKEFQEKYQAKYRQQLRLQEILAKDRQKRQTLILNDLEKEMKTWITEETIEKHFSSERFLYAKDRTQNVSMSNYDSPTSAKSWLDKLKNLLPTVKEGKAKDMAETKETNGKNQDKS